MGKIATDAVKVSNKDKPRRNIAASTTSTSCDICWPSMCNAALDGDGYSGRTEPAEVSRGHGVSAAAAASFLCLSLVRYDHKAKTRILSKHHKHAASPQYWP